MGSSKTGATIWTLLVLSAAGTLIPAIVVLGFFKFAELKRTEDLKIAPEVDEWDRRPSYRRQSKTRFIRR